MRTILLVCIGLLLPIYLFHRCDAETEICPPRWMTSRGACYSIFCEKRTWAEAERDCRKYGTRAHLASILDEKETTAVSEYIVSLLMKNLGPIWIGMFYKGKNSPQGEWWWKDNYKAVYFHWAQALPEVSENKQYCVYLRGNEYKYWKETDCKQKFGYICKYELKYQRR